MLSKKVDFIKAQPVWAAKYVDEMNISLVLEKSCELKQGLLRIAAASCYQLFVNGELYNMGPARTGHGFARVDEVPLINGKNDVKIIVAGYNNNSFQYIDEPPFVCAEIVDCGKVVAATLPGKENTDFSVRVYKERVQKTPRYSFQRNFTEVYDMAAGASPEVPELVKAKTNDQFIERGIDLYKNDREDALYIVAEGRCGSTDDFVPFSDRSITAISEKLKGFKPEELTVCGAWEAQKLTYDVKSLEKKTGNGAD